MTYFDATAKRIIRDYSDKEQIDNLNHNDETDPDMKNFYLKRCIEHCFIVDCISSLCDVREALKNPDCTLDDIRHLTSWDWDDE